MIVDILDIMKSSLNALGVQVLYMASPCNEMQQADYQVWNKLYSNFDYQKAAQNLEENCLPDILYISKNALHVYNTFFKFPESIQKEYGYTFCYIGPFLFSPINNLEFRAIMEENNISEQYARELQSFYSQIPQVFSMDFWTNQIISYCRVIFQKDIHLLQNHDPAANLMLVNSQDFTIKPGLDFRTDVVEKRYALENSMLKAIRQGDTTEALMSHHQFVQMKLLPRTSDPVRDRKNLLFVLGAIIRKSVEQAGVHPVYIDDLSRKIAITIENCSSIGQLQQLSSDIVRKYCLLAKTHSRTGYSKLIHECLDFIEFHHMDPVSLKFLAEHFSVSSSYLSSLFKKETGMTLSDYLQDIRLRHALTLLNTTRDPIQEVAAQVGFLDANYFIRVFKKKFGTTPKDYRKQIQTPDINL